MKLRALFFLLCVSPVSFAAESYTITSADMADPTELGKRMGTVGSKQYQASGPEVDTAKNMLGGPSSVNVLGNSPGRDTLGASGTVSATLPVRCGATAYALGLSVRGTCVYTGNTVSAIRLSACAKSELGGSCKDTDYGSTQQARVGQTATFGKYLVRINSCTDKLCNATFTKTDTLTETGSALNSRTSELAVTADPNSAQGNVQTVYRSGTYNAQMASTGSQYSTCFNSATSTAGGGQVSSCDGSSSALVGSVNSSGTCENINQCVQYAASSNYWYETCERSVATTLMSCNSGISCSVSGDPVEQACTEVKQVEVRAEINCTSGEFFDIGRIYMQGLYSGDGDYEDGTWITMQAKCEPHRKDGFQVFRFKPGQNLKGHSLPIDEKVMDITDIGIEGGKMIWSHSQKKLTYTQLWVIPSTGCSDTTCTYAFVPTWYQYSSTDCDYDGYCSYWWNTHSSPHTVFERYPYTCSSGTSGTRINLYPGGSGGEAFCYHTSNENPFQTGCTLSSTEYNMWWFDTYILGGGWTNPTKCTYRPGYYLGVMDTSGSKEYSFTRTLAYQRPGWRESAKVRDLQGWGWLNHGGGTPWVAYTLTFDRPRVVYREYETTDGGCDHLR